MADIPQEKTKEAKPKNRLVLVLSITCIIALLVAGYLTVSYQNVINQSQNMALQINDMRGQNSATRATVDDFRHQSKTILEQIAQNIQQLNQQQQEADKQLKTMAAAQGSSDLHWRLAETNYLLDIAERKLQFEHDKKSATALLETAVDHLAKETDPKLLPLRTALTTDLQTVKGLPEIDVVQWVLDVNALAKVADQLPLLSDSLLKPPPEKTPELSQDSSASWQSRLQESTQQLMALIKVRETQQLTNIFLTQEQENLVRLMLQSKLNLLQILVLHQKFSSIASVVSDINQLVSKYYLNDAAAVKGFQESLQKFANIDYQVQWPDLQHSVQALAAVRDALTKAPS